MDLDKPQANTALCNNKTKNIKKCLKWKTVKLIHTLYLWGLSEVLIHALWCRWRRRRRKRTSSTRLPPSQPDTSKHRGLPVSPECNPDRQRPVQVWSLDDVSTVGSHQDPVQFHQIYSLILSVLPIVTVDQYRSIEINRLQFDYFSNKTHKNRLLLISEGVSDRLVQRGEKNFCWWTMTSPWLWDVFCHQWSDWSEVFSVIWLVERSLTFITLIQGLTCQELNVKLIISRNIMSSNLNCFYCRQIKSFYRRVGAETFRFSHHSEENPIKNGNNWIHSQQKVKLIFLDLVCAHR